MNLNLMQVCGRITRKPEMRTTPSGSMVATFSVATNRVYKDNAGQKKEEVEFHNVIAWGKTAENIEKYFDKGDEIYIQGHLKTNQWDAKDGSKRSRTDIVADRFDFGQKKRAEGNQTANSAPTSVTPDDDWEKSLQPDQNQENTSEVEEVKVEDIPF